MRAAAPQPWLRTGPGTDLGGQPKFDLSRFDPAYFQRLRERVGAAQERGIFVIVMLFEAHVVQIVPTRNAHPFYWRNNINDTRYLENVEDIYTLRYPQITEWQQRYVRAVVDSVNDFDNVLYEVADEGGSYSTEWQLAMLSYLRAYQAGKPTQHPAGMTFQINGRNATLFDSDADWVSPGAESGHFSSAPLPVKSRQVIIADTDHLGGASFGDSGWVWRSFFRGLNVLYMDNYVAPDSVGLPPTREAAEIRAGIGLTRLLADQVDIGKFAPNSEIASTGFALQSSDALLVYVPSAAFFTLDLRSLGQTYLVEWFDIQSGSITTGAGVRGGAVVTLRAPDTQGSVLYLRNSLAAINPLSSMQSRAQKIWRSAIGYSPWHIRLKFATLSILRPLTQDWTRTALSLCASFVLGAIAGAAIVLGVTRRLRSSKRNDRPAIAS